MAVSRGLSAISFSSDETHFRRQSSLARSDSQSSADSTSSQPRAMPIHSRRPNHVPPPIPPPQYIEELDRGYDIAYDLTGSAYRNTRGLPPIPEQSSLNRGTYTRPGQPMRHYRQSMDLDEDSGRRLSGSSIMQFAHPEGGVDAHTSRIVRRAPSPSNSSTLLQGELPLVQESHDRSNRDYDHAMLSKIGKPNSPPRHPRADSSDSPVLAQKLSLKTKDVKAPQWPSANEPSSAVASMVQWIASPSSTGMSPTTQYGWQDQGGIRSPLLEGGPNTLVLDPELFVQQRPTSYSQSLTEPVAGEVDTPARSARNSYDQAIHTPAESEPAEDSGIRGLNIDEVQATVRRASGTGMKRKAISPPDERQPDERPRQDPYPLHMRMLSKSPNTNGPSSGGSLSSTASSVQPPSFSSSGPFTAAASSMTSTSSFDPNSPRDPSFPASYITSAPASGSGMPHLTSRKGLDKIVPRKLPAQTTALPSRPIPTRVGNNYICACCPKKPKKFETEDQLRQHENEKQYSCNFCHNRFKNKNEAERHQNSLHLRRHSWSCAALANFKAAFSPSGAVDSSSTATDACGYCGEEFPNHPAADWDRRFEHLTNIHKFGECNSAKKFYRADHFRQHLKHSHAGKSGKWTNILEHACVRDEIPLEAATFSTSLSDHDAASQEQGPAGLSGPTDHTVSINVVRASQDDSAPDQ